MKQLLLYCLVLVTFSTCTKVVNLSDNVELLDFKINNATPSQVVFGKTVIRDKTVYLNITQGSAYLPVVVSAEPIISGDTELAVPGSDFSSFSSIRFDFDDADLQLGKSFYLVAKSGEPVEYKLKLNLDNVKARVLTADINNSNASFISSEGYINPIKKSIKIYSYDESFSDLSLDLKLTTSEGSKVKQLGKSLEVNNLTVNFKNIKDTINFTLEASNGEFESWEIFVSKTTEYKGNESTDIKDVVSNFTLKPTSETEGIETKAAEIYEKESLVVFPIVNKNRVSTFKDVVIAPNWNFSRYAVLSGLDKNGVIVFKNAEDTVRFKVMDRASGIVRTWKSIFVENNVTDVLDFKFNYTHKDFDPSKPQVVIDTIAVNNTLGVIELKMSKTPATKYWPVTISPTMLGLSPGATHNLPMIDFNLANAKDEKKFTVTGYDGRKQEWTIKLLAVSSPWYYPYHSIGGISSVESNIGLTVNDFLFPGGVATHTDRPYVYIDIPTDASFPIEISPHFKISILTTIEGFRNGDFITFNSMKDEFSMNIIAENGESQVWYIRLLRKAQPMNSDFEIWTADNWIASLPVAGRGWTSANNKFVDAMTTPIKNDLDPAYGLAAQMITGVTKPDAMGPRNLLTAGTLFLGKFVVNVMNIDNPKKMTRFGIPWSSTPVAIEIDYKYKPGPKYQYSKLVSGSGISAVYKVEDLAGVDTGQIWVQLIHYKGTKDLIYDGEWEEREDIVLLAKGEHICTEAGWNKLNLPIERQPDFDKYKPTHILVTMSSSIKGDYFIGAIGSTLTVDNFKFIYD